MNYLIKKTIIVLFVASVFFQYSNFSLAAGNDSSENYMDSYSEGKKIILRANKLEKKNKTEKANKLYAKALEKFEQSYKTDRNNPDVLNYLGFTLRKIGKFDEAEKFYNAGLKIKPDHNGINEYLGELYVQTNRLSLAKERLEVLKNCNCEEYQELKKVIESK